MRKSQIPICLLSLRQNGSWQKPMFVHDSPSKNAKASNKSLGGSSKVVAVTNQAIPSARNPQTIDGSIPTLPQLSIEQYQQLLYFRMETISSNLSTSQVLNMLYFAFSYHLLVIYSVLQIISLLIQYYFPILVKMSMLHLFVTLFAKWC